MSGNFPDALDSVIARTRQHGLGDLTRRSAARLPDKTALIDGDVRLSFAELDELVRRTANHLISSGLAPGDKLALLSHNCWQFVVLNFATARAGIVLVPINFMLGAAEVRYILEHSEAGAFVAEQALVPVADEASTGLDFLRLRAHVRGAGPEVPEAWSDIVDEWTRYEDASEPDVAVGDDDPIRLMYTSGTESRPKGALLSSRSLLWNYVSCIIEGDMAHDDVEAHALPLYHCAALDCFLTPDLFLGATSIVLPDADPARLLRTIESEGVTKLFCPPTVWIALLRHPSFEVTDLSTLRKGYYGASPMPVEVLREIQAKLPQLRLWNMYGQTEMAPLATLLPPEDQVAHAGSAGRPVLNVETRIVDDADEPVSPGEIGEVVHRSPQAALGYYKDEEKTAEAFRNGWFHSGDLGIMDDEGRITIVDRKKDMIKTGGENVASREVEETIYLLDGISEAAVFAVEDDRWVEAVAAAVVAKDGVELTPEQVVAHCRSHLAGYKTPKRVVIVDSLPKNPSGKVLKRELRQHFAQLPDVESLS